MQQSDKSAKTHLAGSRRYQKYTGLVLAALAGGAVMVVELGVARVLTPVFGGSITVWAIVIATTMLALALGYAFGGYRADRVGGLRVAGRAAAIGALLCAGIPFLRIPLIEYTIDLATLTGATIAALVLIAPALFFFSQVSPALIRDLNDAGISHVGVTAGGVYAVSTVGSLIGTLAAVWLFLYLPLQAGFIGTALLVLVPVFLLQPLAGSVAMLAGVALFAMSCLPGSAGVDGAAGSNSGYELVAKKNSAYGEIRVVEENHRYRYMIVNGFDQGGIILQDGESVYHYVEGLVGLARLYVRDPERVLIIGLGPGVMATALQDAGMAVETVEIDRAVWQVAREYFAFDGRVVVADGRRYLQQAEETWDIIFVDAFAGGSPPWQLYTTEAFSLYASHLEPGGAVVLNFIGSHLDAGQLPALKAVASTARQVFPVVDVYPDPWGAEDFPVRNIFIVAAHGARRGPLQPGDPRNAGTLSQALARTQPISIPAGRIFTDESAPLEPLVRRTTHILRNRIREYLPAALLIR